MLNLTASRIVRSEEMAYQTASPPTVVGQTLVMNGPGYVKPGSATASEVFVGLVLSQPMTLTNFPKVEDLVANASAQFALSYTPIAGTLRIVAKETGSALTAGNPGSVTTEYSISGATVTVHVSRVTKTQTCYYQFVPDTLTARLLQGDIPAGGAASLTTGTVGVMRAGLAYTSEYDPTVDWTSQSATIVPRCAANSRITLGSSGGCIIPGGQVVSAPSTSDALLGIYFSA